MNLEQRRNTRIAIVDDDERLCRHSADCCTRQEPRPSERFTIEGDRP
jgi:hypothetical protein